MTMRDKPKAQKIAPMLLGSDLVLVLATGSAVSTVLITHGHYHAALILLGAMAGYYLGSLVSYAKTRKLEEQ